MTRKGSKFDRCLLLLQADLVSSKCHIHCYSAIEEIHQARNILKTKDLRY